MADEKRMITVTIRLKPSTVDTARALATADRRKLAGYLAMIVEDHIEAQQPQTAEKPKGRKP